MLNRFLTIYVVGMFFCNMLSARIIESYDLKETVEYFQNLDSQILIVWDVDDTLIIPNDLVLRQSIDKVRLELIEKHLLSKSETEKDLLSSQIFNDASVMLIDPLSSDLITSAQNSKIPTIALTAWAAGNYGVISSIEDWRFNQLKRLGIDFSSAFSDYPQVKIDVTYSPSCQLLFKQGILYSNIVNKGLALAAFFKQINWKPNHVIFLDDILSNLISVENEMNKMGISFLGIHYRATAKLDPLVNPEIARIQYQVLLEQGVWLSDAQALEVLQQNLQ